VNIVLNRGVSKIASGQVVSNCVYTGSRAELRLRQQWSWSRLKRRDDVLYHDLLARQSEWADAGIKSVKVFGDAEAPGPIAWATYAGHRYARELDGKEIGDDLPFRREIAELMPD
jgi:dimethylamine/trimethylamine dehydrogenase